MKKLFWLIFALAFLLRFWNLGKIPASLDWDEVSNAYNAYSILQTGRDEYGKLLPLYNRSFDDYKPPLYMYLNVPSVALFGLNPFGARLPSALFGTLSTVLVFFLAKRLFEKENIALTAMLLSAVSPWELQFSRVGFEANIGLFFTLASFTSLLYALPLYKEKLSKKKIRIFLFSALLFGLSFYSYHAQRIFIPLLFFASVLILRKEFLNIPKKYLALFVLIAVALVAPFFFLSPKEAILQRFQTTSSASKLGDINQSIQFIEEDNNQYFTKIIHNRRITITVGYLKNYFANLDPNFLFMKGDNNFRHHVEGMGMLYLFELPFLLIGVYKAVEQKTKPYLFVLLWLLLSPIAAAPTDVAPHAIRTYTLVVSLEILVAIGLVQSYNTIKWKSLYVFILSLLFLGSVLAYLENYYVHYRIDFASWWQYGYLQAANETQQIQGNYDKIFVDSSIEQAYAFWLFQTEYNPAKYQEHGSKNGFGKFYFSDQKPSSTNELLVTTGALPQSYVTVKTINQPNGKPAVFIGHPK